MSKLSCVKTDFPHKNLKKMKDNQVLEDRIDRNRVGFLGKSWEFLEAGHLFETNIGPGTRLQKDSRKVMESHEFVKIHVMCSWQFTADSCASQQDGVLCVVV